MKLLVKHKAPLSLYDSFQQWAKESSILGHDFRRPPRPRTKVVAELQDRFDFASSRFKLTVISYLPDECPTVVHISSFSDGVFSLLTSPKVTNTDTLAFPDPYLPYPSEPQDPTLRSNIISELHHGKFYKATHLQRCTGPIDVLCPVIFYMDGVSTDANGRLGLTPLNFTLEVFSTEARRSAQAWVTLYFHPDDEAEAALHVEKTEALHKVQNLHRGLDAAFAEFRLITEAGGSVGTISTMGVRVTK